jgi:C_GCAxxG_C_C family probable redox protein
MNRADNAHALMSARRMNCAQAVLTAFCEELGLERRTGLKLAQGFGAGMGRSGSICGAVTGAYMVLGLAQDISPEAPRQSLDEVYAEVREFNQRFKDLHRSLVCRDLVGHDLSTPEGMAEARSKKVTTTVCPELVRDAVNILDILLKQKQH